MKATIEKYGAYLLVLALLLGGAALAFHLFGNPLKGMFSENKPILYEPGKDPKIHEMFAVDSVKSIYEHKLDSISQSERTQLKKQIEILESDAAQSETQVTHLISKKQNRDKEIDAIKPGSDKEDAINKEWEKRHKK